MKISQWGLLTLLLCSQLSCLAQKLKKADRMIVSNVQGHVNNISGGKTAAKGVGIKGDHAADGYVAKQFSRFGLKPVGDSNSYYQKFTIYDGKTILPSTYLAINNSKLKLHEDYFPFTFSASKKTEAAVAIALAENGVPWFKDIKELLNNDEDSIVRDTMNFIKKRAAIASGKGASALIIYNSGNEPDMEFNKFENSGEAPIPVLYIKSKAFKKHCSDESEIIDISLNVAMQPKSHEGTNIIGFADNHADSTIMVAATMENMQDAGALIEVARLLKGAKGKKKNYLFIAFRGDASGEAGMRHYRLRPSVDPLKVTRIVMLDTVSVAEQKPRSLHLVKQSVDVIKNQ